MAAAPWKRSGSGEAPAGTRSGVSRVLRNKLVLQKGGEDTRGRLSAETDVNFYFSLKREVGGEEREGKQSESLLETHLLPPLKKKIRREKGNKKRFSAKRQPSERYSQAATTDDSNRKGLGEAHSGVSTPWDTGDIEKDRERQARAPGRFKSRFCVSTVCSVLFLGVVLPGSYSLQRSLSWRQPASSPSVEDCIKKTWSIRTPRSMTRPSKR